MGSARNNEQQNTPAAEQRPEPGMVAQNTPEGATKGEATTDPGLGTQTPTDGGGQAAAAEGDTASDSAPADAEPDDGLVAVTLGQHWTDEDGENHMPYPHPTSTVRVTPDQRDRMRDGGYIRPDDTQQG